MEFDRQTGVERTGDHIPGSIDSIAPLPVEIYNVMLGLDRRMRLATLGTERFKVSKAEIDAIGFANAHYPANPLAAATSND